MITVISMIDGIATNKKGFQMEAFLEILKVRIPGVFHNADFLLEQGKNC